MFEFINKLMLRLVAVVVTGTMLGACAAAKNIRSAADIADDGKRNTLVMSYDLRLDSHDRYPSVRSTQLALRCGPRGSFNSYPVCFYLTIPFAGKRQDDDFVYNSFERSDVTVFQMKYGDYNLARASHSVVVGRRQERICYPTRTIKHSEDSDHYHRTHRCYDDYVDIRQDFMVSLPANAPSFSIDSGEGCYLGHLTLHMRGNRIEKFDFDSELDPQLFDKLPQSVRDTARARVTQACEFSDKEDLPAQAMAKP